MKTILFLLVFSVSFNLFSQDWENIGPGGGSDIHVLVVHPTNADIVYAGGDIEGVFKSVNGGQTWKNINSNLAQMNLTPSAFWISDIIIDPNNSSHLFLCTAAGLFHSTNAGDSWQTLYSEFIDEEPVSVSTLAVSVDNPSVLYMGLGDRNDGSMADFEAFANYEEKEGLYKSIDNGTTWTEIEVTGLSSMSAIHSIVTLENNQLIISTTKGVFYSNDGGSNWQNRSTTLPHENTYILKKAVENGSPILYLTLKAIATSGNPNSYEGGFYRSNNLGQNWVNVSGDLPIYDASEDMFYDYWKYDINPINPNHVLISPTRGSFWENSGIFECTDVTQSNPQWHLKYVPNAGAWMDLNWYNDPYAFDIAFAPSNSNRVYYCNVYINKSDDGGTTFNSAFSNEISSSEWIGNGLELMNIDGVTFHPTNSQIVYLSYDDMGLFKTENHFNSYKRLDSNQNPSFGTIQEVDGVKDVLIDPDNGQLYVSRWGGSMGGYIENYPNGGVIKSTDGGLSFQDITNGAFSGRSDLAINFSVGTAGNRTIYSAVYHHGVFKSTNDGQTWTTLNNGILNPQNVWDIAINPTNTNQIFVSLNNRGLFLNALYMSNDAGNSWNIVDAAPQGDILEIVFNSQGEIFIAVSDNFDWPENGGVYRSSDNGLTWNEIFDYPLPIDIEISTNNDNHIIISCPMIYKENSITQGVYLSKDKGVNWQNIAYFIPHSGFNFAKINPHVNDEIIVGTSGGGIWRNTSPVLNLKEISNLNYDSTIFPNPVEDVLNLPKTIKEVKSIKIYNIDGQIIENKMFTINENKINLKNLTSGFYYIEIISNEMLTLPFIKK
ncbi:MAG: T9SS type A sorting domain-containing protein [Flavobacteriia bacterium]|nr:T9SS type A sorting domain-containing protein [Flavobacteriia bacterium]